jgi:hypothetical protein
LTFRIDDSGRVFLEGKVAYDLECRVPTAVDVKIEFPSDYPFSEPRAYDSEDHFPHIADRHFYKDGRCCMWIPPKSEWSATDPEALLKFLDQVVLFFHRQLIADAWPPHIPFLWPGGEWGHGVSGYLELLAEKMVGEENSNPTLLPLILGIRSVGRNDKCPCGSNRKYKKCHLQRVEKLRGVLSLEDLDWISSRMGQLSDKRSG